MNKKELKSFIFNHENANGFVLSESKENIHKSLTLNIKLNLLDGRYYIIKDINDFYEFISEEYGYDINENSIEEILEESSKLVRKVYELVKNGKNVYVSPIPYISQEEVVQKVSKKKNIEIEYLFNY